MENEKNPSSKRILRKAPTPSKSSVFDDDYQADSANECENFEKVGANMENKDNQNNENNEFMIPGDTEDATMESTEPELLPEGDYTATIGEIWLEKVQGSAGKSYMKVTVPFDVELESGETRRVYFSGSTSLATTKSRFRPIVEGVLGAVPKGLFDVRTLEGKRVIARVGHNTYKDITRNQVDDATLLDD